MNLNIRARILEDIYKREEAGQEILVRPSEYANLLGISEALAEFNIQYLIDAGLVKGQSRGSLGTTKRWSFVTGLTSFGVAAVERQTGQDLAVNFSIINLSTEVTQSQIAVGSGITQTQSVDLNTLHDVTAYLDQHFAGRTEVQES